MITVLSLSPAVDKIYIIENFEAGGLFRVGNVIKSAGGKGINVARVIATLGEKVSTLGFKAGKTGTWLESELEKCGVSTSFIEVVGESRTNNNIIDRLRGTETEVLEIGPFINEEAVTEFLKTFNETLKNTDILVCSGGLPEGIPCDFYRTLIEIAATHGIKVILDTSNRILEEGLKAKPYLVKPNLRELSMLVGRELKDINDIINASRYIISQGVEVVVASLGGEGGLLVTKDTVIKAVVPCVDVINTIGSGDSSVAGIAVGLSRNESLENMLRLGMACAVSNTQHREIGFVLKEEVENYIKEIIIEEIIIKEG